MSAPEIINPGAASGGIPVGGSGAAGYVAKWTAATTLGGSTISGATASLYVDATGQVGIGTASPAERLAVSAPPGVSGVVDILSLRNPNDVSAGVRISLRNFHGNLGGISARQVDNGAGANDGILDFQTSTNSVLSAKMTILDNGNVGIGTASPAEKVTVAAGANDRAGLSVVSTVSTLLLGSSAATEGARTLAFNRSTGLLTLNYGNTGGTFTAGLTMDSAGKFGIGTTSPAGFLQIANPANDGATHIFLSIGSNRQASIRADTSSIAGLVFATGDSSSLVDRMFIDRTTGNVGIGTTSPTAALHLPAGTTARASLNITSGAAPTSPNNGDVWFDGANIFMRVGGVTKTFTLV